MAEALIRRFKGIAKGLPEVRMSQFAVDVLNVYEKEHGYLRRREGVRRSVQYKAPGPILEIIPSMEPSGEYTGRGERHILWDGEWFRYTGDLDTLSSGATGDTLANEGPTVTEAVFQNRTNLRDLVNIYGSNFDDSPENPIQVEFVGHTLVYAPRFHSSIYLGAKVDNRGVAPGTTVDVIVTNPDGQSFTLTDGYTF